jgi:hypothetical protein
MKEERRLAEKLFAKGIDWRFPDEFGFSERNLDCKQLAVKEILEWKGEINLIPVFLNPFDCQTKGVLLRRSEPTLQRGFEILNITPHNPAQMDLLIQSLIDAEGYCLIYFNAYHMPFSSYYQMHEVIHWALVVSYDQEKVTMVDHAGNETYYKGYIGEIPWDIFKENWVKANDGGVALVKRASAQQEEWEACLYHLLEASYYNMHEKKGLQQLHQWIEVINQMHLEKLIQKLNRIEFDVQYFRRLRELWMLAVNHKKIPRPLYKSGWVEELYEACTSWSLVMGVLMKWKRQPKRNYREKLIYYLKQAHEYEEKMIEEIGLVIGGYQNEGS